MAVLRAVWRRLTKLMEPVGEFVSRCVVLPVLYLVLGALFTLPARWGDPLHLRRFPEGGRWREHGPAAADLDAARRMH